MDYLGEYAGWQVYRNSEGFLEGVKSTGVVVQRFGDGKETVKQYSSSKRILTNQTTTDGFVRYVKGIKNLEQSKRFEKKVTPNFVDPNQLKIFE